MLEFILILISAGFMLFCILLACIIKKGKQKPNNPPDFLMILGCKVKKDLPSKTLQSRIDSAKDYLLQNQNVIAFCCGGIVQKDQIKTEAQVIADILISYSIDKSRLILEDKSTTTVQNFQNVKNLIETQKLKGSYTIAFLTSDFHVFRSEIIAKKAGLDCKGIGAKSPNKKKIKHYIREAIAMPFAYFKKYEEI